ncbi:ELM1/GtrOC1 family putative glycosyltransferase, partial [Falsiroseomonas selenitidurans]
MTQAPPVWVLADPRAGTAAQALGIAERLGWPHRVVPLAWGPLARLPLPGGTLLGLTAAARAGFTPPWPGLVIAAGRRAGPWGGAGGRVHRVEPHQRRPRVRGVARGGQPQHLAQRQRRLRPAGD